MSDILSLIAVIYGVISIVMIVVYFQLASNVRQIKEVLMVSLRNDNYKHLMQRAKEEQFIGNTGTAKELLLRAKFHIQKDSKLTESNKAAGLAMVDQLISEL